jgi:hypothetical protein
MRRDESCKVVCRRKLSQEAAKNFKEKIDDEYRVNMYGLMLNLVFFLAYCSRTAVGNLRIHCSKLSAFRKAFSRSCEELQRKDR